MENKRLKKLSESARLELEQLRQDLTISQQTAAQAMAELEAANKLSQSQLTEARESSAHVKSLEAELERVTRNLNDNLARQPVFVEQIQVSVAKIVQLGIKFMKRDILVLKNTFYPLSCYDCTCNCFYT